MKAKMVWANGRKVHWLGYNKQDMMRAFRPFSCDTTSWAAGPMYGRMSIYFGKGRMGLVRRQEWVTDGWATRSDVQRVAERYDISFDDLCNEEHWHNGNSKAGITSNKCAMVRMSAMSWMEYSRDMIRDYGVRVFMAVVQSFYPLFVRESEFLRSRGFFDFDEADREQWRQAS